MAPRGRSSGDDDKANKDDHASDFSMDDGNTKRKRKDTKSKSGKKAKPAELILDLSEPDAKIADVIKKLRKECWSWAAKPIRAAPPRDYELTPPVARIVDGQPSFDEALHDFTAFAIRSYHDKKTCAKYTHDFEVGNGLLRGSRIPLGTASGHCIHEQQVVTGLRRGR